MLRQCQFGVEGVRGFPGGLWAEGKLVGKAGSAFTSTIHGGNESTLITMYNFVAHLGLFIVPLGYGDPVLFSAGTPYWRFVGLRTEQCTSHSG